MKQVGIVIATFGDKEWRGRGEDLYWRTYHDFAAVADVTWCHGESLGQARNEGADRLDTEWLIFLDADDVLEPGYVEAMLTGTELLRQPATRGFYSGGEVDDEANVIPPRNLLRSNHLVIGTMCNHELFDMVGQFDTELGALEDWDLWIRMYLAGANYEAIPEAVYWVFVNDHESRNSPTGEHDRAYREISRRYRNARRVDT